jgi:putative endonuclease
MRRSNLDVGKQGEDAAVRWLESREWTVHARGERIAGVEVDVLATDPSARTLVIVEVKARRVARSGFEGIARPEENVNRDKLIRLSRAAHALEPRARQMGLSIRVDVIAVGIGPPGAGRDRIDHFPDATC